MIKINNDDMDFLRENNIDISKQLQDDDIESLLEIIDDAIVDNIVDNNDEPDENGIHLQLIYDRINADNAVLTD